MNTDDAPKIEFPCDDYVIKVVGDAAADFKPFVTKVLKKFDESVHEGRFRENPSKNGNFVSLTIRMRIEQESHLEMLFVELKANTMVKMVL